MADEERRICVVARCLSGLRFTLTASLSGTCPKCDKRACKHVPDPIAEEYTGKPPFAEHQRVWLQYDKALEKMQADARRREEQRSDQRIAHSMGTVAHAERVNARRVRDRKAFLDLIGKP